MAARRQRTISPGRRKHDVSRCRGRFSEVRSRRSQPLFAVHLAPFPHRHRYVVAPDGARFLLNEALQESSTTMTVVVNWTTELKK